MAPKTQTLFLTIKSNLTLKVPNQTNRLVLPRATAPCGNSTQHVTTELFVSNSDKRKTRKERSPDVAEQEKLRASI